MKKIKLTQSKYALVDNDDFDSLNQYKWYFGVKGNATRNSEKINGVKKTLLMHRIIMKCPDNLQVDHRNHNKLDNQKQNLRICNNSENQMNRKKSKNNTSGYKGVSFRGCCYRARIMKSGKMINIGQYKKNKDAAKAYDIKAKELFGEFACLNFPKENSINEMV